MIAAARANGIDGPFCRLQGRGGYRREAAWVTALAAVGKWAIHPGPVETANEVLSRCERAKAIVENVREAEAAGAGAANDNDNGVMIAVATARIYEATLERTRLMGTA